MEGGRASLLLSVLVAASSSSAGVSGGYVSSPCYRRAEVDPTTGMRASRVLSAVPQFHEEEIPEQWLWNDVNGKNYLTKIRNQHLPVYCGSCWALAATSSLSDRIKIAREARWPDVNISPQLVVSCDAFSNGCFGGDPASANAFMADNDATDETCSIYQARDLHCTNASTCVDCDRWHECKTPQHFYKYRVAEFGDVFESPFPSDNEKSMMAEIYHRGPISCAIAVPKALENYTSGVFHDQTGATSPEHAISVVGYGVDEESGLKYWLVRNSWGEYWGEGGFFRLIRGVNNLGIEWNGCDWATPKDTWSDAETERAFVLGRADRKRATLSEFQERLRQDKEKLLRETNEVTASDGARDRLVQLLDDFIVRVESRDLEEKRQFKGCAITGRGFKNGENVLSPRPQDYLRDDEVPENWDWRDVNGTNYLSWTVNQHVPIYCGSCWAEGTTAALADRFIIADNKKHANLALSPQAVVNCRGGGTCSGGSGEDVYDFARWHGIPSETCQPYQGLDPPTEIECDGKSPNPWVCKDCSGPAPQPGLEGNCWAKDPSEFKLYKAKETGRLDANATAIKKEIYARGPVACGIFVSDDFMDYRGGIFNTTVDNDSNHILSLVGFGKDQETGKEYWIGRNSWGTGWGEHGFFKIKMHEDNLGVERGCFWATPMLD